MSNLHLSEFDEGKIDHAMDNQVTILLSGEDSRWFVNHYHQCIHTMTRFKIKDFIRKRMKVTLNFLILERLSANLRESNSPQAQYW